MRWRFIFVLLLILFFDPVIAQKQSAHAGQWTIVACYNTGIYLSNLSSLTWDGTNMFAFEGGQLGPYTTLYRFDPQSALFTPYCHVPSYYQVIGYGPPVYASGVTYKSPNFVTTQWEHTWYSYPSVAVEFDRDGNPGAVHPCPNPYIDQICWDTDHFWGCVSGSDHFYKFDANGNTNYVIDSIPVPVGNMCIQDSYLWFVSSNDSIYKIDQNGLILERHACSFGTPSCVIFDGSYLWYSGYYWENQIEHTKLIKVDLNGPGSPSIHIDSPEHDYGLVLLQDSSNWSCTIRNPGTAPLIIDQFTLPPAMPFSTDVTLPLTINPEDSVVVNFTFLPVNTGRYDINVILHSNDVVYPDKTITLKGIGIYSGAHVDVTVPNYNYGERRLKSTTCWKAHIVNDGSQPLSISSITTDNPVFTLDKNDTFPVDIPVIDTIDTWIWFQPREVKLYTGTLSISSNSATQNPFTINITGTGKDSIYPLSSRLWSYTYPMSKDKIFIDERPVAILPIGDITGDSITDLVVNFSSGQTKCLNGNASGQADILWSVSFCQYCACRDQQGIALIPDIDGDSINDVIIAPYEQDTLYTLSGRTGKMIWNYVFTGAGLEQIDVNYDYNGDGFPDVLVAVSYSTLACQQLNNATIYCLDGRTGSVIWFTRTSFCSFSVKGVPDFTGDGKPDVIAGIREFENEGTNPSIFGLDGVNGQIVYNTLCCNPDLFLVIEDITGDGLPDIAAANEYYSSGTTFSLINLKTGIELCDAEEGFSYLPLKLVDMGVAPGDTLRRILFSGGSYIAVNYPPECWGRWRFHANIAANAGDLNGDSINDVFFVSHNYNGTSDTIGYLNGRNGHILKAEVVDKNVTVAQPFIDLIGKGYPTVIIGGVGYLYCLAGAYVSTTGIGGPDSGKDQKPALQVFPNPTDKIVNIRIELTENSFTRLEAYDSRGILVESILNEYLPAGKHDLILDISRKSLSGLYFLRLVTERHQETVKLIVVPSK